MSLHIPTSKIYDGNSQHQSVNSEPFEYRNVFDAEIRISDSSAD
jgi:hypothetical protein